MALAVADVEPETEQLNLGAATSTPTLIWPV